MIQKQPQHAYNISWMNMSPKTNEFLLSFQDYIIIVENIYMTTSFH